MAHDVFISYSSKDRQVADAVCKTLEANKVRCWYAPRDVRAGVEWTAAIMEGITHSQAMILVWSSSSNMSKDVTREVKHAFRHDVTVIPFRIEDITATPALQYYLGDIHWLDALPPPFENHLQRLLKHVQDNLQEHRTEVERRNAEAEVGGDEQRLEREAKRLAHEESRRPPPTHVASEPSSTSTETDAGPLVQRRRYGNYDTALPVEVTNDEERRQHTDARRFARLLITELKLYNEQKMIDGRSQRDLYNRLRDEIDHQRKMYDKRVKQQVAAKYDYFHNELVDTLAEGDPSKLGAGYPGPTVITKRP